MTKHESQNNPDLPTIVEFVDEGLGHTSYLVDLGNDTALVVDPARLPIRQQADARQRRLDIALTADTHTHADYVSGSADLAATGATQLAPAAAKLTLSHIALNGGDQIDVGRYQLRTIATPGHTPDHLAYLLVDDRDTPLALFSGGSLMVGTLGRTDLAGPANTEALARAMFHSVHERLLTLPDDLAVYPTHGAGSFCAAPSGAGRSTTIGHERVTNPLLQLDENTFVEHLIAGFGPLPPYFHRLPELNRVGPHVYPSVPSLDRLDTDHVASLQHQGAVIIDARPITDHAASHPVGAISIQLRSVFGTWLAWLTQPDMPIVFILNDDQNETELIHQALTVGIENLAGRLDGGIKPWQERGFPVETTPLVTADSMSRTVIDVRHAAEYATGHVPGAINIELGNLAASLVPQGPVTVMCGHGERAMTGASLLQRAGHHNVSVLDGGPEQWTTATGSPLEHGR